MEGGTDIQDSHGVVATRYFARVPDVRAVPQVGIVPSSWDVAQRLAVLHPSASLKAELVFERFVEIGRVAFVAVGKNRGTLCAIVDVIDQKRALVDGPCTGFPRQQIRLKKLHLTSFKIRIPHSARTGTVRKAWEKAEVEKKWRATTWAKKLAAKKRKANMTDFDRYKLMRAKQKRTRIINTEVNKLKKAKKEAAAAK